MSNIDIRYMYNIYVCMYKYIIKYVYNIIYIIKYVYITNNSHVERERENNKHVNTWYPYTFTVLSQRHREIVVIPASQPKL